MSNRRKDRKVPNGFVRYNGEYTKQFYKVITFNGVLYESCWPNAGTFHTLDGKILPGNDVFAVRGLGAEWGQK